MARVYIVSAGMSMQSKPLGKSHLPFCSRGESRTAGSLEIVPPSRAKLSRPDGLATILVDLLDDTENVARQVDTRLGRSCSTGLAPSRRPSVAEHVLGRQSDRGEALDHRQTVAWQINQRVSRPARTRYFVEVPRVHKVAVSRWLQSELARQQG